MGKHSPQTVVINPHFSLRAYRCAVLIMTFILPVYAATPIPSSTTTVNLQDLSATSSSFTLPATSTIATQSGDGISGDASRSWLLNLQGAVTGAQIGVNLASSGGALYNTGTLTGMSGTAILLSGSNNNVLLDSGSTINGDVISTGAGNTITLQGSGVLTGDLGGTSTNTGFSALTMNGSQWDISGNINLTGNSPSSLSVASGGLLVLSGKLNNSSQGAGVTIAQKGFLQIGNGGTSGEIDVPIFNDGTLTFYRSDTGLALKTPLSGDGVLLLRGTGVSNQSSYVLSSNSNSFAGNVIIGSGARLQVTSSNPAPQSHVIVNDGGTLWLGSSAAFTTPIVMTGNGWTESSGQLGALRLDSGATTSGPVTLAGNSRITAVFSGYTGTISGPIGDAGQGFQLEKVGGGLITLSGNSTYSGGTLLSEGTLSVSQDSNLGMDSSTLIFNGGTLLTIGNFVSNRAVAVNAPGGTLSLAGSNTFSGGISGAGHLTLTQGALTLAGEDSRTGSTQINAGSQLMIGSDTVNNAAQGTLSGDVLNNGTLTFNRAGSSTYAGVLSGQGALVKQHSGLVGLSGALSSQSSVSVNGGTLAFNQAGGFTVAHDVVTATGAQTALGAPSFLQIAGTLIQQAGASLEVAFDLLQPAVNANQILLDGVLKLSGSAVSASSLNGKLLTILHSNNALGIVGDFSSLGFSQAADYLIVTGSKANNDRDYHLGFGLTWFAGPALGNGVFTLTNPPDTFNVDVVLDNQSGPFTRGWDGQTLTKAGAGTLLLSSQNTYTGKTLINGGVLQAGINNAFALSSAVNIAAGATLNLNNFDQIANNPDGAGNIALGSATLTANNSLDTQLAGEIGGSGALVKEGAQSLTLSGLNTFSGGTQIRSGTLVATSGDALGTGAVANQGVLNLDIAGISQVHNLLSGPGLLEKNGAGIAVLTQNGSSVGSVNVNSGAVNFGPQVNFISTGNFYTATGAATGIGMQGTVNAGGLFDMKGALALIVGNIQPVILADLALLDSNSSLNVAGISTQDDTPQASLADNTYRIISTAAPGNLVGDFAHLRIGGATSPVDYAQITGRTDVLNQHYDVGISLTWYASQTSTPQIANGVFTLNEPQEQFELSSVLVNQVANPVTGWDGKTLTKAGLGTLILSRHNLYSGATLIKGGVLQTGIANALSQSSNVNIADGALLFLNDFDQSLNDLSGEGNISLGRAQLNLNNHADSQYSGVISGSGGISKNGSGTLLLTADNTFTGATDVNRGSLGLGDASGHSVGLASSQVNIAPGAVLGGYANLAGSVNNQGTLAVGDALPVFATAPAGAMIIGGDVQNSGTIIMASPLPASSLTIKGNYIGNGGLLTLSTVLGGDNSATDKLIILGNSSGDTRVRVNNAGGVGAPTLNGIEIISVGGQSDGHFILDGRVVAGAYDYFLQKGLPDGENGNWYLRNQPPSPPTPTPPTEVIRPEAGSYLANSAAARSLFNHRLEDRAGRAENSTLWLRQNGSRNSFYDSSGQLDTDINRYVIQGGGEVAQGQFGQQDRLGVGLMLGYGQAHSTTYANRSGYGSKGQIDGYSGGVYATWYQNSRTQEGMYVDTWLQYSSLNASVKGDQLSGENYDINGLSSSVESGYRLPLYLTDTTSLNLTPQVQLIWDGLQADDHTESNGSQVTSENNNNLQSRVGVKLSHDGVAAQDVGSGKLFTTFVETNWIYNSQPTAVSLDGESVQQAGARNLGEVKVGVEGQLNHHLNVWSHVGEQLGGAGYSDVSVVIGLNYQF